MTENLTKPGGAAYLVEYGGASSDKAYKYAGSLTLTGPFGSAEDAWAFAGALDDGLLNEYRQVTGFAVILGHIDGIAGGEDSDPLGHSGGLTTPRERLGAELSDLEDMDFDEDGGTEYPIRSSIDADLLVQLDRWWPDWMDDLQREYIEAKARWADLMRAHKVREAAGRERQE
jgi:hypothetical protein